MDPPHFLPRREPSRWQVDKSKHRFQKSPCLLRGEKRAAAGERSVDGPDEIKRRDTRGAEEHFMVRPRPSPNVAPWAPETGTLI